VDAQRWRELSDERLDAIQSCLDEGFQSFGLVPSRGMHTSDADSPGPSHGFFHLADDHFVGSSSRARLAQGHDDAILHANKGLDVEHAADEVSRSADASTHV
jgi:hypothetical protein